MSTAKNIYIYIYLILSTCHLLWSHGGTSQDANLFNRLFTRFHINVHVYGGTVASGCTEVSGCHCYIIQQSHNMDLTANVISFGHDPSWPLVTGSLSEMAFHQAYNWLTWLQGRGYIMTAVLASLKRTLNVFLHFFFSKIAFVAEIFLEWKRRNKPCWYIKYIISSMYMSFGSQCMWWIYEKADAFYL